MPDYNPDREGHHKHKFIVQKAFPSDDLSEGVDTARGTLTPNDQGRMVIADEGFAREVQKQYPRELVVTRMNEDDPADRGHNYFFQMRREPIYKIFDRWKVAPIVAVIPEEAYKLKESQDFYGINNYYFDDMPTPVDGEIGYDDNRIARIVIERQHRDTEAQEVGKAEPGEEPAEEQEVQNA